MAQKIDGLSLPEFVTFKEINDSRFSKNYTVSGKLFVDFTKSIRKGWLIALPEMTKSVYENIRAKYEKQFSSEVFLRFEDDELAINRQIFLQMPEERDIIWNKGHVQGFTITLESQDAEVI